MTKPATIRLTTKGQVTLPKAIRDAQNWDAGQVFVVEQLAGGLVLRSESPFALTRFEDVFGSLARYEKPMTEAQIKAALSVAAKRRYATD